MPEAIVFANASCSTTDPSTGMIVRLVEGEPWSASDPFVIARPMFFGAFPDRIRRTVPFVAVIETASKAPGEKRATRNV